MKVDHGNLVGDDVVQIPCNPQALFSHPASCNRFPSLPGAEGPFRDGRNIRLVRTGRSQRMTATVTAVTESGLSGGTNAIPNTALTDSLAAAQG